MENINLTQSTHHLFELFQQFWGQNKQAFTPPLTIEEIDQKIAELNTIEQWLKLQVSFIENGIKTLEIQKAGIAAFTDQSTQAHKEI